MSSAVAGFFVLYSLVMTIAWLAAKGRGIQARKKLEALEKERVACSCGHTIAFHEADGKRCHANTGDQRVVQAGRVFIQSGNCTCQRYDGPPSMWMIGA